MKENAYLLNCRTNICDAIAALIAKEPHVIRKLIQAVSELDYYRHGPLQRCDTCGDINEEMKGP